MISRLRVSQKPTSANDSFRRMKWNPHEFQSRERLCPCVSLTTHRDME